MTGRELAIAGVTAAVVLVATTAMQWVLDTGRAGLDAEAEAQIKAVVGELLVTPDGTTYGAVLSTLGTDMAVVKNDIENIKNALDKLTE